MKMNAIRSALEEGYEDRGVFEPDEEFWNAVKQVIDLLERKDHKVETTKEKMSADPHRRTVARQSRKAAHDQSKKSDNKNT